MAVVPIHPDSTSRFQILSAFRHQLRLFLQFSEEAANNSGLQPQQYQLLLHIAGAPHDTPVTIGYVAGRLALRHNTAVELCNRCEEAGLILRKVGTPDRRSVVLALTPEGRRILDSLSEDHARELNERAPQLIRALTAIRRLHEA
jgi:DNA-binding MarR family transcriptional regulator